MTEEIELARKRTAWVRGTTNTKMGTAILTTHRLAFFDEKFASNAAFGLANLLTDALQKRHEDGGPLLEVPLDAVTGTSREKKLMNKDRIRVTTAEGEYLFNDGWKDLEGPLRRALSKDHARRIVEVSPEAWRAEPA